MALGEMIKRFRGQRSPNIVYDAFLVRIDWKKKTAEVKGHLEAKTFRNITKTYTTGSIDMDISSTKKGITIEFVDTATVRKDDTTLLIERP